MRTFFIYLKAVFLFFAVQIIFPGCTSQSNNQQSQKSFSSPLEFAEYLHTYKDSVMSYNTKWGDAYKNISTSKTSTYGNLKLIREDYEKFIDRSIEEITALQDVGNFSRELKVTYVEFLKVQKENIEKYLSRFEELEGADSVQIKKLFEKIEGEGYVNQLSERDAMIKIITFRKLYYKENGLEIPGSNKNTSTEDTIKK